MSEQPRTGIGVIFLTIFMDLVGFSILFPLFADMLHYYGEDGVLLKLMAAAGEIVPAASHDQRVALFGGMLLGTYSLLQFIAAPLWGRLSDRIGRRPVLLLTIGGNTLGYLLWIVADSFTLLLVSRLFCGLMAGNISVATAAVADISSTTQRTRSMAVIGMAFGLGFLLGPAIGGPLAGSIDGVQPSLGLGWHPFSVAAAVACLLSAINLVWVALRFRETNVDRQTTAGVQEPGAPVDRAVRAICRVNLIFIVIFAALEGTLVFLAKDQLAYSPLHMAGIFVLLGIVSAGVQGGLVRRLAPRLGPKKIAVTGFLILVPAFTLIGLCGWNASQALLLTGVALIGLGTGFIMPSLSALVSLYADPRRQGHAMGRYRSAGALGRAIGPFAGAIAYFAIGAWAPYAAGAVLLLVPLVIVQLLPDPAGAVSAEATHA